MQILVTTKGFYLSIKFIVTFLKLGRLAGSNTNLKSLNISILDS